MKINKKLIAREWLNLFIGLLAGIIIMPLIDSFIDYTHEYAGALTKTYLYIFKDLITLDIKGYADLLIPYILYQLVRLTIWAIKTIKK